MAIRFDHSVPKVRKDGVTALSDSLEKGEKLVDGTTYAELLERGYFDPDAVPKAPKATTKAKTRAKK